MNDIVFRYAGPAPLIGLPDHDITQAEYDRLPLKLQAVLDTGVEQYEAVTKAAPRQSKRDDVEEGGER